MTALRFVGGVALWFAAAWLTGWFVDGWLDEPATVDSLFDGGGR